MGRSSEPKEGFPRSTGKNQGDQQIRSGARKRRDSARMATKEIRLQPRLGSNRGNRR